jgi:hypothetical protein
MAFIVGMLFLFLKGIVMVKSLAHIAETTRRDNESRK